MVSETHIIGRWLRYLRSNIGRHVFLLLTEKSTKNDIVDDLRDILQDHYDAPLDRAERIEKLGVPASAKIIRSKMPTRKTARSGDISEILAVEVVEYHLHYKVPLRRLRHKSDRDMPLYGNDILAIANNDGRKVQIMKGEVKSRERLSRDVIDDASHTLDTNAGMPSPQTINFLAKHLRNEGNGTLACELEEAMLNGFKNYDVSNLIFVFSGTDPRKLLKQYLTDRISSRIVRYAVGLYTKTHSELIEQLYGGEND